MEPFVAAAVCDSRIVVAVSSFGPGAQARSGTATRTAVEARHHLGVTPFHVGEPRRTTTPPQGHIRRLRSRAAIRPCHRGRGPALRFGVQLRDHDVPESSPNITKLLPCFGRSGPTLPPRPRQRDGPPVRTSTPHGRIPPSRLVHTSRKRTWRSWSQDGSAIVAGLSDRAISELDPAPRMFSSRRSPRHGGFARWHVSGQHPDLRQSTALPLATRPRERGASPGPAPRTPTALAAAALASR